jgi:hypothetical protein
VAYQPPAGESIARAPRAARSEPDEGGRPVGVVRAPTG